MANRKKQRAERIKVERRSLYIARLNNCPTSPRKMRLVADMVRGLGVEEAANILQFSKKEASQRLEKLLWSAIANFEQKTGEKWENSDLFIKEVTVDSARMLKRVQPAPQGRAHRIRKRSNHITIVLDSANYIEPLAKEVEDIEEIEEEPVTETAE